MGTLARGIFFLFFPTYLLVPIIKEEAEGENYRLLLQMTRAGVREGVVEQSSKGELVKSRVMTLWSSAEELLDSQAGGS